MTATFEPGDHLHVRRPLGYFHHGIYVSDDRVIQFGSGISLADKSSTSVNAVSLADFAQGGTARVVRHGYESRFSGWHPPADEPWKIIERAEFLLKLQPKLPYNLIGHNCEHMATLCAVNRWAESYQVRRFFGINAGISSASLIYVSWLRRKNMPVPSWANRILLGLALTSFAAIGTYNHLIKKLWDEIRDDWFAFERRLEEDPRNGQSSR